MKKIYLVEDDRTMQSLLKTLLEIDGYTVFPASQLDKNNILNDLKVYSPDVVLMDVRLQQSSGIEILSAIKSEPRLKAIKVIMTSGMAMKEVCINNGADAFIQKPYMPDVLMDIIKSF
ncbi:MAG: response regulator [Anaerolineae bacterium]|nr:response regulator [Anaerolineae bacterium]